MYRHIEKVKKVVEDADIKFTVLKSEITFNQYLYEYEPKRRNPEAFYEKYGKDAKGYSWAYFANRWCTGKLKIQIKDKYLREIKKQYNLIEYVGLAADEEYRLERKNNQMKNQKHPLVEWGWTEKDCLDYCYSLGYDWEGLYNYFSRVSCWCCPLQPLGELRILYKMFPELWQELKEMDSRTFTPFKDGKSVEDLEVRFKFEEQRLKENKSIKNREFFTELKTLLTEDR